MKIASPQVRDDEVIRTTHVDKRTYTITTTTDNDTKMSYVTTTTFGGEERVISSPRNAYGC